MVKETGLSTLSFPKRCSNLKQFPQWLRSGSPLLHMYVIKALGEEHQNKNRNGYPIGEYQITPFSSSVHNKK